MKTLTCSATKVQSAIVTYVIKDKKQTAVQYPRLGYIGQIDIKRRIIPM